MAAPATTAPTRYEEEPRARLRAEPSSLPAVWLFAGALFDRVPEELGEPLVGRVLAPGVPDEPGAREETEGTTGTELLAEGTGAPLELSGTSGTGAEEDSMMGGVSPGRLEVGSTSPGVELSS